MSTTSLACDRAANVTVACLVSCRSTRAKRALDVVRHVLL